MPRSATFMIFLCSAAAGLNFISFFVDVLLGKPDYSTIAVALLCVVTGIIYALYLMD